MGEPCLYADVADGGCALRATADSPPPTSVQLRTLLDTIAEQEAEIERLRGALRAVVLRHQPIEEEAEQYHKAPSRPDGELDGECPTPDPTYPNDPCPGHLNMIKVCSDCGYGHDGDQPICYEWPCPTVRVAMDALAARSALDTDQPPRGDEPKVCECGDPRCDSKGQLRPQLFPSTPNEVNDGK